MARISNLLSIILLSFALIINQGELYLIFSILLILNNSVFIIPLLIYYPIVGSALDEFSILPTELLFAGFMIPFLIFNIKNITIGKYRLLFIYIYAVVILGFVVGLLHSDSDSQRDQVYIINLIIFIKVTYYFLLFLYLSSKPLTYYTSMLQVLKVQFPIFIMVLYVYILFFGKVYGEGYLIEYVNFGIGAHGYYGSMLALISSVLFFNLLESKSIVNMIFLLSIIVLTLYLITISGSRNGFATFVFINFLTFIIVKGMKINIVNILIISGTIMIIYLFINNIEQNAVLNRTVEVDDVSSGRFDLWKGGYIGFLEFPITGIGKNDQFEKNYLNKTVDISGITHNTLVEFALVYGVNGIILFMSIIYLALKGFYLARLNYKNRIIPKELFIPSIMLFSVLFSSNFVSWTWDSIVWYPFIISLSLTVCIKLNTNYGHS